MSCKNPSTLSKICLFCNDKIKHIYCTSQFVSVTHVIHIYKIISLRGQLRFCDMPTSRKRDSLNCNPGPWTSRAIYIYIYSYCYFPSYWKFEFIAILRLLNNFPLNKGKEKMGKLKEDICLPLFKSLNANLPFEGKY